MITIVVLFVACSAFLAWFSWPWLRNTHAHGFYRFFGFESVLVLFFSNIGRWFDNPFSALQLVSWFLLISSSILAVHGFRLLQMIGKPSGNFENTTNLVTAGAYRSIRHPLYSSLILLTWGIFFKDLSLIGFLNCAVATIFFYATARIEESENRVKFGEEYSRYVQSTKMFIPHVF